MNKPSVVITHHALSRTTQTVNDVDDWHRARWPGFISRSGYHVGYHYVIESTGEVTKTRDFDETGAHTIGMNNSSIGVCFMGDFDKVGPTRLQMKAWYTLFKKIRETYPDIPTQPHRAYAKYKSCHGTLLSENYFTTETQKANLWEEIKRLRSILANLLILGKK